MRKLLPVLVCALALLLLTGARRWLDSRRSAPCVTTNVLFKAPAAARPAVVTPPVVHAGETVASAMTPAERKVPSTHWTRQLRDETCACRDVECLRGVNARFTRQLNSVDFAPEDHDDVAQLLHETSTCEARLRNRTL